jgi:predicted nucleic acid-binding protein
MATVGVYVDTSVWNAAFDEHVPNIKAQTVRFFERLRDRTSAHPFLSDVVLQELGNAPSARVGPLAGLIRRVHPTRIELAEEAAALADAYISHGVLREGHLVDARHVAIATVAGLDAIVSWNYRHLVNRRRREAFNGVNAIQGYRSIEIISPPEVFDE